MVWISSHWHRGDSKKFKIPSVQQKATSTLPRANSVQSLPCASEIYAIHFSSYLISDRVLVSCCKLMRFATSLSIGFWHCSCCNFWRNANTEIMIATYISHIRASILSLFSGISVSISIFRHSLIADSSRKIYAGAMLHVSTLSHSVSDEYTALQKSLRATLIRVCTRFTWQLLIHTGKNVVWVLLIKSCNYLL